MYKDGGCFGRLVKSSINSASPAQVSMKVMEALSSRAELWKAAVSAVKVTCSRIPDTAFAVSDCPVLGVGVNASAFSKEAPVVAFNVSAAYLAKSPYKAQLT